MLVREAKRVQSLFSKEFLALVVNACIAKAGKKVKGSFRAWQNSNHVRSNEKDLTNVMCLQILHEHKWVKYFLKKHTLEIFSCLNEGMNFVFTNLPKLFNLFFLSR